MTYNLIKHTEEYLVRKKFPRKNALHYYPSEASVRVNNTDGTHTIHGTCLRQAYFRCKAFDGQPYTPKTELIFKLGKATEEMLVEQWKQMGIWVDNNVKWYDTEYNISGELDVILKEPEGLLYGVEIKSFWGYQTEALIYGTRGKKGRPKTNHLLQTLVYKHEFPNLEYFKIVYLGRDKAERAEFNVKLIADELEDGTIVHRPSINDEVLMDFTMEDILQRYRNLDTAVKTYIVPQRDFELKYSKEKIEDLWKNKQISKSKYLKWQSCKSPANGAWPGDWQCQYCPFSGICWDKAGNPKTEPTAVNILDEIISNTE